MKRRQRGFTYLGLLFAVAMVGIALATSGVLWSVERQREKEKELLAIGKEFREAIRSYYESSPGNVKRYPAKLDELLKDVRFLGVRRHLRKVYADPMTGTREWGVVTAPEGGIMGVYSTSERLPIKQAGFEEWCWECAAKTKYSDWRFVYRPPDNASAPPKRPAITS